MSTIATAPEVYVPMLDVGNAIVDQFMPATALVARSSLTTCEPLDSAG
jgi:hypothetical protein